MTAATFDRIVRAIHFAHEVDATSPLKAVLERAAPYLEGEDPEVLYTVEGGHVVQGDLHVVFFGDDGEVSVSDVDESVDEACSESLDEEISRSQLASLERAIDKLFAAAGIDVEFTRHFMERVNDARNIKEITIEELAGLFRETWAQHRKTLEKAKPNWPAILQDVATDINVPIVMDVNQYGELELVAKTVMRKKGFTGRAKRLRVKSECLDEGFATSAMPGRELSESVPLKCPDCRKALKKGPLFREATMQVKRKCAGCGAKWNVMLRPKGVERGGKRKATITTADFTRIESLDEGARSLNVATTPLAKARAYAEAQFAKAGKSLDEAIPDFDKNYLVLQKKLGRALDIPRVQMPVIEPTDMPTFEKRVKAGKLDIFKPWARGKLDTPTRFTKKAGEEWVELGYADGDRDDDKLSARVMAKAANTLLPTQSQIWLEKLIATIVQLGVPTSSSPIAKAPIIVSKEGYILDGHHRFGQAMLANPTLGLRALFVPLDIKTLLRIGRSYGEAIGNKVKEDDEPVEELFGLPTKLLPLKGALYRVLEYVSGLITLDRIRKALKGDPAVRFDPTDHEIARVLKTLGWMRRGETFVYEGVEEGIHDPYILKAVFTTGGAGAGKSFIAHNMFGGMGLKVVNSDSQLERAMRKAGLDPRTDVGAPEVQRSGGIRDRAKATTNSQLDTYVKGRLGLVIDSTAAKLSKVIGQVTMLRGLGYDISMVFVNTSLETALARNRARPRTVPEDVVRRDWAHVQANLKKYRTVFGPANFREVSNDEVLSDADVTAKLVPRLTRVALSLLNRPVQNPVGKAWMEAQTGSRKQIRLAASVEQTGRYEIREGAAMLTEDVILMLGALGSVALGALLGHLAVKTKRTVQQAVQLHKKGEMSAAEAAMAKLSTRDRDQLERLLAAETKRLRETCLSERPLPDERSVMANLRIAAKDSGASTFRAERDQSRPDVVTVALFMREGDPEGYMRTVKMEYPSAAVKRLSRQVTARVPVSMYEPAENRVDEAATVRVIDARTKRMEWEGSLREFLKDNEDDEEVSRRVRRLRPGQSVRFGGGASPETIVTRVESTDEAYAAFDRARPPMGAVAKSNFPKYVSAGVFADLETAKRAGPIVRKVKGKGVKGLGDWSRVSDKEALKVYGSMGFSTSGPFVGTGSTLPGAPVNEDAMEIDPEAEFAEEMKLTLDEHEWLHIEMLRDEIACAIDEADGEAVNEAFDDIGRFERLVEECDYEAAELVADAILERIIQLDEIRAYKRMTIGARTRRLRARRMGITKAVKTGQKSRADVRRENRLRRRKLRMSPAMKMKAKRLRRRRANVARRRRPLSVSRSESVNEAMGLLSESEWESIDEARKIVTDMWRVNYGQGQVSRTFKTLREAARELKRAKGLTGNAFVQFFDYTTADQGGDGWKGTWVTLRESVEAESGLDEAGPKKGIKPDPKIKTGGDLVDAFSSGRVLTDSGVDNAYAGKKIEFKRKFQGLPVKLNVFAWANSSSLTKLKGELGYMTGRSIWAYAGRGSIYEMYFPGKRMYAWVAGQAKDAQGWSGRSGSIEWELFPESCGALDEMAKLGARGRTELLRYSKEGPGDGDLTDWERTSKAFMSDGTILVKRDVRFRADEMGGKSRKHSYGWKVHGKVKPELKKDPARLREALVGVRDAARAKGWKIEMDPLGESLDEGAWLVKHDFRKYQPKWNARYVKWFGPNNEGKRVEAPTADAAIKTFAKQNNLNPFYLTAEPLNEDVDEGARPGHMFVVVDTSVPGGRMIGEIITGVKKADAKAAKLRAAGKDKVQVIDALWYGPAREKLVASGVLANEDDLDEAASTEPRFAVGVDDGKLMDALKKQIKAPYVAASLSTLGGEERATIMLAISLDPRETWTNGIYENSRYLRFSLGRNGVIANFARAHLIKTKFRKQWYKNQADAIKKLNAYVSKAMNEDVEGIRFLNLDERLGMAAPFPPELDEDLQNAHGVVYTDAALRAMYEEEDLATVGTFEEWCDVHFKPIDEAQTDSKAAGALYAELRDAYIDAGASQNYDARSSFTDARKSYEYREYDSAVYSILAAFEYAKLKVPPALQAKARKLRLESTIDERLDEARELGDVKKRGEWNLHIWRGQPSKWAYFLENPQGGGFGTSTEIGSVERLVKAVVGRAQIDKPRVYVAVGPSKPAIGGEHLLKREFWVDSATGEIMREKKPARAPTTRQLVIRGPKAQGKDPVSMIQARDQVTIVTPQGNKLVGSAVMRGPAGWVLNMGGRHGTPAVASERNILLVKRGGAVIYSALDEVLTYDASASATFSMRGSPGSSFGVGPKYVPKPRKTHECPECREHHAYWKEVHADCTGGMNEVVLYCPDCKAETTKENMPESLDEGDWYLALRPSKGGDRWDVRKDDALVGVIVQEGSRYKALALPGGWPRGKMLKDVAENLGKKPSQKAAVEAIKRRIGEGLNEAKDPMTMTAAQINKELDKLGKESSKLADEMISAGRGHETASETRKASDPLARRWQANMDRHHVLRAEIDARYGPPGQSGIQISRLPMRRGSFGPRKNEAAPPGFEGTVKALKKSGDVDNPFALAWWMKKRGMKSHKKVRGADKERSFGT
jgi:predicted kinase